MKVSRSKISLNQLDKKYGLMNIKEYTANNYFKIRLVVDRSSINFVIATFRFKILPVTCKTESTFSVINIYVYNYKDDLAYVFGGRCAAGRQNDLYQLNLSNFTWTQIQIRFYFLCMKQHFSTIYYLTLVTQMSRVL